MGVPDRQLPALGLVGHRFAVFGDAGAGYPPPLFPLELVVAAGYGEAGDESFHVPFERSGIGFVEIVDIERELAFRCRESPKLLRCASPHSWVCRPVLGDRARSSAITSAAPRKNENCETAIRPYRMGTSSGTRVLAWGLEQADGVTVAGPIVFGDGAERDSVPNRFAVFDTGRPGRMVDRVGRPRIGESVACCHGVVPWVSSADGGGQTRSEFQRNFRRGGHAHNVLVIILRSRAGGRIP